MSVADDITESLPIAKREELLRQRGSRYVGLALALGSFFCISCLGTGVILIDGWNSANWQFPVIIVPICTIASLVILITVPFLWWTTSKRQSKREISRKVEHKEHAALAALAALEAPSDAVLPRMKRFPVEHPSSATSSDRYGLLTNFALAPEVQHPGLLMIGIASFLSMFIYMLPIVQLPAIASLNATSFADYDATYQRFSAIVGVSLGIGLLLQLCVVIMPLLLRRRQLREDGGALLWPRFHKVERLPWTDILSICSYQPTNDEDETPSRTYVIATKQHLLTWKISSKSSPTHREDAERLIDRALLCSGLPLRDLTPLIDALADDTAMPEIPSEYVEQLLV